STTSPLTIGVTPTADAPILSIGPASGKEDSDIPLSITTTPTGDGHETLTLTISGVPNGAALNHGTDNGDGTWTLTPAQLRGLTLTPPENFAGTLNLTITSTASENGTQASTSAPLNIAVSNVVDAPTLTVGAANGVEDQPIALNIASALVDN